MKRLILALTVLIGAAHAQDDWYPSQWGADDTLGAANHLSAEGVVNAAKLVTTGKTYSLGVEVSRETPAYGTTRTFQFFAVPGGDGTGAVIGSNEATSNDDYVFTWIGIGSQIDGLGHLGINHRYYNGLQQSEIFTPEGLAKLGVNDIPPIVTRGVLLDMTKQFGKDVLDPGTAINQPEIDAASQAQGVTIGKGDVVLLHTGWLAKADTDPDLFVTVQPGLGVQGAQYLAEKGVVAVGADTIALEVIPFEKETEAFPVHQTLLAKNGVYILETLDTRELAADGVSEFLFVLGQLKMKGSVQMMINPIAIR